jgi:hypothetical protein
MNTLLIERYVRYRHTLTELELQTAQDIIKHSEQAREWKVWLEEFYSIKDELAKKVNDSDEGDVTQTNHFNRLPLKEINLDLWENETKLHHLVTKIAAKTNQEETKRTFFKAYISEDQSVMIRLFCSESTDYIHIYLITEQQSFYATTVKLHIKELGKTLAFDANHEIKLNLNSIPHGKTLSELTYEIVKY